MDCSSARTRNPVEWIELCPEFSWPLAEQVREWFLTWEPDLTESIKWNMLCFSGRKRGRSCASTPVRSTRIRHSSPPC
jgi:hypothetical protein